MSWQTQSFNWPISAQTIQSQSEQVLAQAGSVAEQAANRLAPLAGKVSFNRHALSVAAENLLQLRGQLDNLLCRGQVLSVHPYQFFSDNTAKQAYHLTPANAVKRLADKLVDSHDENRPVTACYALGIMIAEPNLAAFAISTRAVFNVLSLPDLGMVSRRAKQGLSLEQDKLTLPLAAKQPLFKPTAALNSSPLCQVLNSQGAQLAQLESIAADKQTPIATLQALAVKRGVHLNQLHDAIEQLKQSDIQVRVFAGQGTPDELHAQLQLSTPPGQGNIHTFAALLLSETPLTFIGELFA